MESTDTDKHFFWREPGRLSYFQNVKASTQI
jgi:hypothetical protein